MALMASTSKDKTKRGYNLIEHSPSFDGLDAWNRLEAHFNNPSMTNKLMAVMEFIRIRQQPNESSENLKIRLNKAYDRINTLHVSLGDIKAVQYMIALTPKYSTVVTSLAVKGDATFEQICHAAHQHEQHLLIRAEDRTEAYLVDEYSKRSRQETTVSLSNQQFKELVAFASSSHSSNHDKKSFGSKLSHNVKKNPKGPTEYERTLVCKNCGLKGHALRTCNKPLTKQGTEFSKKVSLRNAKKRKPEVATLAIDENDGGKKTKSNDDV
jgi:hypothetical protein